MAGPPPSLLGLGNLIELETNETTRLELEWSKAYGPVYGVILGTEPILTVNDPELVKQIFVKDFHLFVNRRSMNTFHELVNNGQFFAEDSAWKRVRTITGPTFTTSKLKKMLPLMDKCVEQLKEYLNGQIQTKNGQIQAKEVFTGFAIDVISSSAFATETNANTLEGSGNAVITSGMNLFEGHFLRVLSFLVLPRWINNFTGIKYPFKPESFEYLSGMVREIIRQRKQLNGSVRSTQNRQDFVQALMDTFVDASELTETSFDKLTAQTDSGKFFFVFLFKTQF